MFYIIRPQQVLKNKQGLVRILKHFYKGIYYKYPLCCVIEFCFLGFWGYPSALLNCCHSCGFAHCRKCAARIHPENYIKIEMCSENCKEDLDV